MSYCVLSPELGQVLQALRPIFLAFEVLSNVVDGRRAHPAISGCFFHLTIDECNTLDDLGDGLVAPESVPVFFGIGSQFEYHGESGYA